MLEMASGNVCINFCHCRLHIFEPQFVQWSCAMRASRPSKDLPKHRWWFTHRLAYTIHYRYPANDSWWLLACKLKKHIPAAGLAHKCPWVRIVFFCILRCSDPCRIHKEKKKEKKKCIYIYIYIYRGIYRCIICMCVYVCKHIPWTG